MTIRKRLVLSQIAVFLIPVLMTLILLTSALSGLLLYVRSGNHVMAESAFQFSAIAQVIHGSVFHFLRHSDDPRKFAWIVEIIDPVQNLVVVEREGLPLYRYGNRALTPVVEEMKRAPLLMGQGPRRGRNVYMLTEKGHYYFVEKQVIHGVTYHLYFASRQLPHGSDEAIENAFHGTVDFILLSLAVFVILTSWFLSRFIGSKIMGPLAELERGAEEIRKGNLDVRLTHGEKDEFQPTVDAFNLMARELKESLTERERQEERRRELVASISHDIRTPLTAIKAYVEGLLDGVADTPEKQARYLTVIRKKTDVLDTMVQQLFLLSKMDLGGKAIPLEPLDLAAVVRDTVEENRAAWERDGARLTMETVPARVLGNRMLLERVVENLVGNSVKYKNGNTVDVHLSVAAADGRALLTVADDGPGVAEEALPRLMEPFYRTDKARTKTENGSGLGLAIVARAAEVMGGHAAAAPAAPHGLSVTVELPGLKNEELGVRS